MMMNLDYHKVFQTAPDGMSISRVDDGLFLDVNVSFTEMFGYAPEDIVGKTSYELNFWSNFLARERIVAELEESGRLDSFETAIVSVDGRHVDVMLSARKIGVDSQLCLLLTYKNVTTLAQTVQALQTSEKKFKDIFDMTPDSMIISDSSGCIHDVNAVFESLSGYSRDEIIGKMTTEVGLWENLTQREDFLSHLQKDGRVLNYEINARSRSGEVIVALASAMQVVIDGEPRILTIARDITEIKNAEKQLREEERRYRELSLERQAILEAIPDSVVLWSKQREVVWTNRNAEEYLKVHPDKAVGRTCKQLCQIAHDHQDCPLYQCAVSGEPRENIEKFSNGETWEIKAYPVFSDDGEVSKILTLSRDITDRIRLRDEAGRSSRLAALGELAAGIAHEINNPTGLILMNASLAKDVVKDLQPLLAEHIPDPGPVRLGGLAYQRAINELPEVLTETVESGQRIKQIVEDLKDFSRPAPHDTFEPVDLNEVVEKSLRLMRIAINKATDNFVVDYDQTLPRVMGNVRQLEQVMVNLLSNACQALRDRSESLVVAVYEDPANKCVCLKVWDEGVGIDEQLLDQIADPFFTTKRESGGTGLGLSVTSRIVEEHNGHIYFESTPRYGTTVTVHLPAIADSKGAGI